MGIEVTKHTSKLGDALDGHKSHLKISKTFFVESPSAALLTHISLRVNKTATMSFGSCFGDVADDSIPPFIK